MLKGKGLRRLGPEAPDPHFSKTMCFSYEHLVIG
jgi:hypothetical protein